VKGGAKGKKKAASKAKAKATKKETAAASEVGKRVDKILKYTPSKSKGKKEGTPQKGKISTARKSTAGKQSKPAMPSPGGKKSPKTTDQMTMNQFKQYLEWHEKKKKTGKSSSSGKVLGKRSTGKASSSTGKKSAPKGKKSNK
jgi:hypothetical protein